mgnify:FL=1
MSVFLDVYDVDDEENVARVLSRAAEQQRQAMLVRVLTSEARERRKCTSLLLLRSMVGSANKLLR